MEGDKFATLVDKDGFKNTAEDLLLIIGALEKVKQEQLSKLEMFARKTIDQ